MRKLSILALIAVGVVACGAEEPAETTLAPTTTAETTSTTTSVPPTSTVEETTTPTSTTTSTSTTAPTTTTTLAGEEIEFGPAEGDVIGVIGVAHDDVLNLRSGPGVDYDVVGEIPPLADDVTALGETRDIGQALWIAVEHDGADGWVNFQYTAHLGVTDDETSAVIDEMGERPTADTMEQLGEMVAESMASEEPPSDLVMVAAPEVGDLGEVTFDVVGLGDDAVAGLRVHVFGEPIDEGFSLRSVEVTTLCGRGVTDDGLCL